MFNNGCKVKYKVPTEVNIFNCDQLIYIKPPKMKKRMAAHYTEKSFHESDLSVLIDRFCQLRISKLCRTNQKRTESENLALPGDDDDLKKIIKSVNKNITKLNKLYPNNYGDQQSKHKFKNISKSASLPLKKRLSEIHNISTKKYKKEKVKLEKETIPKSKLLKVKQEPILFDSSQIIKNESLENNKRTKLVKLIQRNTNNDSYKIIDKNMDTKAVGERIKIGNKTKIKPTLKNKIATAFIVKAPNLIKKEPQTRLTRNNSKSKEKNVLLVPEKDSNLLPANDSKEKNGLLVVAYKKIKSNLYIDIKPYTAYENQACSCKRPYNPNEIGCQENCLNRMMYVECDPDICPCGDKCDNQRIQKHKWRTSGLQLFATPNRGYGVRTTKPLKSGDFIMEYTGEVVSVKEFERREKEAYHSSLHHYCLYIDRRAVIDAYRCGSLCRFVNHSCAPNCVMQKWSVKGLARIALYARPQNPGGIISPGTELTYDYNFRCFQGRTAQPCLCGSELCRGYITTTSTQNGATNGLLTSNGSGPNINGANGPGVTNLKVSKASTKASQHRSQTPSSKNLRTRIKVEDGMALDIVRPKSHKKKVGASFHRKNDPGIVKVEDVRGRVANKLPKGVDPSGDTKCTKPNAINNKLLLAADKKGKVKSKLKMKDGPPFSRFSHRAMTKIVTKVDTSLRKIKALKAAPLQDLKSAVIHSHKAKTPYLVRPPCVKKLPNGSLIICKTENAPTVVPHYNHRTTRNIFPSHLQIPKVEPLISKKKSLKPSPPPKDSAKRKRLDATVPKNKVTKNQHKKNGTNQPVPQKRLKVKAESVTLKSVKVKKEPAVPKVHKLAVPKPCLPSTSVPKVATMVKDVGAIMTVEHKRQRKKEAVRYKPKSAQELVETLRQLFNFYLDKLSPFCVYVRALTLVPAHNGLGQTTTTLFHRDVSSFLRRNLTHARNWYAGLARRDVALRTLLANRWESIVEHESRTSTPTKLTSKSDKSRDPQSPRPTTSPIMLLAEIFYLVKNYKDKRLRGWKFVSSPFNLPFTPGENESLLTSFRDVDPDEDSRPLVPRVGPTCFRDIERRLRSVGPTGYGSFAAFDTDFEAMFQALDAAVVDRLGSRLHKVDGAVACKYATALRQLRQRYATLVNSRIHGLRRLFPSEDIPVKNLLATEIAPATNGTPGSALDEAGRTTPVPKPSNGTEPIPPPALPVALGDSRTGTTRSNLGDPCAQPSPFIAGGGSPTMTSPPTARNGTTDDPSSPPDRVEDMIRCPCLMFREEGTMIQCEKCYTWQHCECVTFPPRNGQGPPDHDDLPQNRKYYVCPACDGLQPPLDVPLCTALVREFGDDTPVDNDPGTADDVGNKPLQSVELTYYRTMGSADGRSRIRCGECYYVVRPQQTTTDPSMGAGPVADGGRVTGGENGGGLDRDNMDIMRIIYLFADRNGQRWAQGHHFFRPGETFHEPSRRFFVNELLLVYVYETVPLDSIYAPCWVLDHKSYCKGRPWVQDPVLAGLPLKNGGGDLSTGPHPPEARILSSPLLGDDMVLPPENDVFVCQFKVDKNAKSFTKISKLKYAPELKGYAFHTFEKRLKPKRIFFPHEIPKEYACSDPSLWYVGTEALESVKKVLAKVDEPAPSNVVSSKNGGHNVKGGKKCSVHHGPLEPPQPSVMTSSGPSNDYLDVTHDVIEMLNDVAPLLALSYSSAPSKDSHERPVTDKVKMLESVVTRIANLNSSLTVLKGDVRKSRYA